MNTFDTVMHKHLLAIQVEDLSLIPADVDVVEAFLLHRLLLCGLMMQACNMNIVEVDILMVNRWRNVEKAGGRWPGRNMLEHYSQIQHLIPSLLQYSQAL